jgi:DNA repair exonuclease SbcCD nuclease subunit
MMSIRWGIIDWLCENSKGVDELILAGDYTNPKDSHPAVLVNRLKESVDRLSQCFGKVIMLYGNHDGLSPKQPFWKFLDQIRPNVSFISVPNYMELSIGKALFVPAETDWSILKPPPIIEWIFTHATFEGAISETGFRLSGVPLSHAERIGIPIISGDIHKPQIIGEFIEYIGAPYHIRFGDQYEPRVMHIDNEGTRSNLYYPAPQKKVYNIRTLEDFEKLPIDAKQHAKIRVHLDRGSLTEWPLIKDRIATLAESAGWTNIRPELVLKPEVSSTGHRSQDIKSPEQLVSEYADRHNAGERHIEVGRSLL